MILIDFFKELLKFKSITPDDDGALNFIAMECDLFEPHFINVEGVKNLVLTREFSPGPHLAFCAHIDVVPPGPGWDSDPFSPLEKDGFIYARGAQDMKAGLAAFICAANSLEDFKGRLSILITSDEEGAAKYGTLEMLKKMQELGCLPDFALVGEPTCEQKLGDSIKIGRRGSINAELIIKGSQGHAAYPEKCENPIHASVDLLKALAGVALDPGSEQFVPSKIVLTNINAGLGVDNVTPSELCLRLNMRNSVSTSEKDLRDYIERLCEGKDYELNITQSSKPFLTTKDSKVVEDITKAVYKITKQRPVLNTKGGTSDARFIAQYDIPVVEFGVRNDSVHAANERVAIKDVELLYEIYLDFLRNF